MLISYRKKFIFIHNYKVAGSSIKFALRHFGIQNPLPSHRVNLFMEFLPNTILGRNYKRFISDKTYKLLNKKVFHDHINARQLKANLPPRLWQSSFKFGFVRNPWDWHVSFYHYARQQRADSWNQWVQRCKSFDEYIVNSKHIQKHFFYDENGNPLVDFVGKFENLCGDFQSVLQKIGIDVDLPHKNKSDRKKDYRKYYNKKTKDIIMEQCKEDLEIFGYDF